jgi:hypothetical protein
MEYTQLTVNDEIAIMVEKVRQVEARHFERTVDIQTVNAMGGNEEAVAEFNTELEALDAQHAFLKPHLDALVALANDAPDEPES